MEKKVVVYNGLINLGLLETIIIKKQLIKGPDEMATNIWKSPDGYSVLHSSTSLWL